MANSYLKDTKTAIILGASGLCGSKLLIRLLRDDNYRQVKIFARSSIGFEHPKITEYIVDLNQAATYQNDFTADEVFCCIGTTKAKTADKQQFYNIDCNIPATAAGLCRQNNINFFAVISAMGANSNSWFFYQRTKGDMEQKVTAEKIAHTYILRPALIVGKRREFRKGEQFAATLLLALRPLLKASLAKYNSISAKNIAKAMHKLAYLKPQTTVVDSATIYQLAKQKI